MLLKKKALLATALTSASLAALAVPAPAWAQAISGEPNVTPDCVTGVEDANSATPGAPIPATLQCGEFAVTNGFQATAVGVGAEAEQSGTAIGSSADADTRAVAVGNQAEAVLESVAIGHQSKSANLSVAIGKDAQALVIHAVSIGADSSAGQSAVALGTDADAAREATAIGHLAKASSQDSIAVGHTTISEKATISAGLGVGFETGEVGARGGFQVVW